MATLREIRGRIVGVKKTQKITKAMKMVAAAKLRRAQRNVLQARPYALKMKQLLNHLSATPDAALNPFVQIRPVNSVAVIVVTSDRGFCGAFNSNLLKSAERHIQAHYKELQQQSRLKFFCVGKKGADYFTKRDFNIGGRYIGVYNNLVFGQAQSIVREVIDGYLRGDYDRVEIVYNEFRSVAQQQTSIEQFLGLKNARCAKPSRSKCPPA
ncbi:MAG: ATP synthase F1 subunit gamma, partial [bacterium]